MIQVTAFLNREEDENGRLVIFTPDRAFGLGGSAYRPGDKLEAVYTAEYEGEVDSVLERVFSDLNRDSGTFVGDDVYPQRSLSVGDVVEANGVRYSVNTFGFGLIDEKELDHDRA